jgi:hypothetical protein
MDINRQKIFAINEANGNHKANRNQNQGFSPSKFISAISGRQPKDEHKEQSISETEVSGIMNLTKSLASSYLSSPSSSYASPSTPITKFFINNIYNPICDRENENENIFLISMKRHNIHQLNENFKKILKPYNYYINDSIFKLDTNNARSKTNFSLINDDLDYDSDSSLNYFRKYAPTDEDDTDCDTKGFH